MITLLSHAIKIIKKIDEGAVVFFVGRKALVGGRESLSDAKGRWD